MSVVRFISARDIATGNHYRVRVFFTANSHQDLTDDVLSFRINRQLGSFLSPLRASSAEIELDNPNGKYSPGNFPALYRPHLELVIEGTSTVVDDLFLLNSSRLDIDGFGGESTFRLFTGFIDEYEIDAHDTTGTQTLLCQDICKQLSTRYINTEPMTRTNVQSVFAVVFNEAGVSNFDVGSLGEVFGYYTVSRDTPALAAINGLLVSGGYQAYVTQSGTVAIREPFYGTAEKLSVASYSGFMGLTYRFNDTNVWNRVRIAGGLRQPSDVGTVATYTGTETLIWPSGDRQGRDTLDFEVAYRDYSNNQVTPAIGVITPVASQDYIFTNPNGDFVLGPTVTVSLGFETAKVRIRNNNLFVRYRLHRFQIRGRPFPLTSDFAAETIVNSSEDAYGRRELSLMAEYLSEEDFAKNYANRVAHMYHDPHPAGRASLRNMFPSAMFIQPGDLISLVHSASGVNSKHQVQSLSHEVNARDDGWIHNMTIGFELARTKVSSL